MIQECSIPRIEEFNEEIKGKRDKFDFSINEIRDAVSRTLDGDIKAVDLKFTLYKVACDKILTDRNLNPCPPMFVKFVEPMEVKNKLMQLNESLPGMLFLRYWLNFPQKYEITKDVLELIIWLVLKLKEPEIKTVDSRYYNELVNMVTSEKVIKSPSIIFSLNFNPDSESEIDWRNKSSQKWTKYAFYPCNLEDLHGMIYDPSQKFKRNEIFYTSLNYCLCKANRCWTWGKSIIGTNMKAVCIVEFVDHPFYSKRVNVTKKIKFQKGSQNLEFRNYQLLNPDYARIKYIILLEIVMEISPDYPLEKHYMLPFGMDGFNNMSTGSIILTKTEEETEEVPELILNDVDDLTYTQKVKAVLLMIEKYPMECELKLTYFLSSLKTLPVDLLSNLEENYRSVFPSLPENMPKLDNLRAELMSDPSKTPTYIVEILFWLYLGLRNPRFMKIPADHVEDLLSCFTDSSLMPDPIHCFKVCSDPPAQVNKSQILKKHFGFIGCENSDVFSMLYHWKKAGQKRCFNDELVHALKHAKGDNCWKKSRFGSNYKTVLVVEYYPHPELMFVGDKPSPQLSLSLRITSYESPCFFHIGSTQLVQVSYLFVYKQTRFRDLVADYSMEFVDFGTNSFFCLLFICLLTRTIRNIFHV